MNTFIKIQGEKLEIKKAAVGGTVPELTPTLTGSPIIGRSNEADWPSLALSNYMSN